MVQPLQGRQRRVSCWVQQPARLVPACLGQAAFRGSGLHAANWHWKRPAKTECAAPHAPPRVAWLPVRGVTWPRPSLHGVLRRQEELEQVQHRLQQQLLRS